MINEPAWQVDKARTMQQERARRDAEEGKRKIDEQMNQVASAPHSAHVGVDHCRKATMRVEACFPHPRTRLKTKTVQLQRLDPVYLARISPQALRNCDAQQRQREQQMTQLENMLQRTPTLGALRLRWHYPLVHHPKMNNED